MNPPAAAVKSSWIGAYKREGIPMIYDQVELFNVAEVIHVPGRPGVVLQRVPEWTREGLQEGARIASRRAAGVEIRMVSEGWAPVAVELACYEAAGQAYVYYGNYYVEQIGIGSEPTVIRIAARSPNFFPSIAEQLLDDSFSPNVWRIVLEGGEMHLIGIEGEQIRPPASDEVPSRKFLAYGTSITQGIAARTPDISYVKQVGWRLERDVLNLGMSGAAHCEQVMADYIAGRNDWEFVLLCMSVNMFNQGVTIEEFRERAAYMACTIASHHPSKPVVCIGLFPFFGDLGWTWPERNPQASSAQYREALRDIVVNSKLSNLYYVDGKELLTRFYGLTHDLLHPGNLGMIEIGERLALYLKPLLKE
jgi:lysophospholipase L1-like esterase